VKREGLATGSLDVARQRIEHLVSSGEIVDAEELLTFLKLSRGELANARADHYAEKIVAKTLLVAPVRMRDARPYDARSSRIRPIARRPSPRTRRFSVLAACLIDVHAIARRAACSRESSFWQPSPSHAVLRHDVLALLDMTGEKRASIP
jgi:hypothetical protein